MRNCQSFYIQSFQNVQRHHRNFITTTYLTLLSVKIYIKGFILCGRFYYSPSINEKKKEDSEKLRHLPKVTQPKCKDRRESRLQIPGFSQ